MIFGLEPHEPLPEHWTPLEAIAIVKCLDADGDTALVLTSTEALSCWEAAGMLQSALDLERDAMRSMFAPDDEG